MSSTTLRAAMLVCAVALSAAAPIKMGGPVQSAYHKIFKLWASDANKADVVATFLNYDTTAEKSAAAAAIKKMTTSGDATYVDVLVCPYGSGDAIKCIDAVDKSYVGPVMVWGGASDAIFDTNCAALPNKNCFGMFTVGSKYTESGLVAIDGKITAVANVAVIVNNNGFSRSVAVGINATIAARAGLKLQSYTTISVKGATPTSADRAGVNAALAKKPDVVVMAGHNKDVEPIIIQIGNVARGAQMAGKPQAVLATNGISQVANYGTDSKFSKCVAMPTQWDSSTATKDPVVGWTSADFKKAVNSAAPAATYQQAAAGGACVAIANALKVNKDPKTLVASLKAMDVDSFYGKLKWDAKGRIQKPMYTVQLDGTAQKVVAPTGTMTFPLSSASCWGTAATGTTAAPTTQVAGTPAQAVSASVFSMMLLALISK